MNKKGFTLIEVLLAVVILGISSLYLFRGLFSGVSALTQTQLRLEFINRSYNMLAKEHLNIIAGAKLPVIKSSTEKIFGREYTSRINVLRSGDLLKGSISFSWQKRGKFAAWHQNFLWRNYSSVPK